MSAYYFFILAWLSAMFSPGTPAPIPPPDLTKCQLSYIGGKPHNCCIPVGTGSIKDFTPPLSTTIRVRPAAHMVNSSYIAKYAKAVQMMKNLPPDHPWHHMQQAKIHCAYCEGAYNVTGTPFELRIHSSWLFFPFHRIYLYFYERILAKLIDDDTFAVPFWSWDVPDGMTLPSLYADNTSSLYDSLRDENHRSPTIVDLNFNLGDYPSPTTSSNLTDTNLRTMYRQMITNGATPPQFLGRKYSKGSPPLPGPGQFEMAPHNTVHSWTGDGNEEFRENMGVFYAAARDPIFYAHHANIDRLWEVWKTLGGRNYDDPDWLDTAFVFWDENMDLVRVRVRDCLDTKRLGYVYQEVELLWKDFKPVPAPASPKPLLNRRVIFPLRLNSAVSLEIERKRVLRSREEKEKEEEILVIDQIEVAAEAAAKFDVYINAAADDASITPGTTQFAGSFVNVPMTGRSGSETMKTMVLLGLTEVLDEIGADGDSSITVSLVPRTKGVKVTVGGVWIQFGDDEGHDLQLIEKSGEMNSTWTI